MCEDILNRYKQINIQIIESIRKDREEIKLFDKREQIVKEILCMNKSKKEIKATYEKMGLKELDKEVEEILKEKMNNVKVKITNLAKSKAAHKSYNQANRSGSFFYKDV